MTNSRLVQEEARLLRRLHKSCWEEWQRGRKQTRIPQFIGKGMKAKIKEQVEVALFHADERDVLEAIHQLSREADGAPWDIPKRAMYLGGQRRELEHLARKIEERNLEDSTVRPDRGLRPIEKVILESAKTRLKEQDT